MGFIMDGLDSEGYDRTYQDTDLFKRIIDYFRPRQSVMVGIAAVIVLNAGMNTALPILISNMIDTFAENPTVSSAQGLILTFLLFGILSWVFNFLRQWYTARVVGDVVLELRQDAFDAVMARDMSFYDEFPSGKIVSRVTSDTQAFANVVTLVLNLLSELLLLILIVGVLLSINVRLTLITLAISPVVVAAALSFRRIARETTRNSQRATANISKNIQETISGIAIAKNFRQEQNIYNDFDDLNAQSYGYFLKKGLTFAAIFPILVFIAGTGTLLVVYFGGRDVFNGILSPGEWFLFTEAVNLFWFPLTSIASFWSQFQLGAICQRARFCPH